MNVKGAKTGTRKTSKRSKKGKQQSSQKSILDHFSVKNSAQGSQDSTLAESSNAEASDAEQSVPDDETADMPPQSSSPVAIDPDLLHSEGSESQSEIDPGQDLAQPRAFSSEKSVANDAAVIVGVQAVQDDSLFRSVHTRYKTKLVTPLDPEQELNSMKPKPKRLPTRPKSSNIISMSEGSSWQNAIVIDTPVKDPSHNTHRDASSPTSITHPIRKKKTGAKDTIPLPDETSQHVRGPQTSFIRPDIGIDRRNLLSHRHEDPQKFYWKTLQRGANPYSTTETSHKTTMSSLVENMQKETLDEDIPFSHKLSPAVARLCDFIAQADISHPTASSHSLWTDKWHPRRAEEVLGNEENAFYLRDWLVSLSLRGASSKATTAESAVDRKGKGTRKLKRPRVVRQAKERKRRKRQSRERWDSDAHDTDEDSGTDSTATGSGGPLRRLIRGSDYYSTSNPETPTELSDNDEIDVVHPHYRPPQFGDQIYNTILLSGPSGCGKTAAAYACAEELGWEVFEVYPGMGERSGPVINKLIGDVGKNHLVQQAPSRRPSSPAQSSLFDLFKAVPSKSHGGRAVRRVMTDDEDSADQECKEQDDLVPQPHGSTERSPTDASAPEVRQSLVLIEEVDVLFKSDTSFWPTLIALLKDCRRPVIMTCNDISLVPCVDLPLQTTLTFSPCPLPLATSYLQLLCRAENKAMSRAAITTLYERGGCHGLDTFSDLRHAITQLQFGCFPEERPVEASALVHVEGAESVASSHHAHNPTDGLREWRLLGNVTNILSCFDSHIHRGSINIAKSLLADTIWPSSDHLIGLPVLSDRDIHYEYPVLLSVYKTDERIAEQAVLHSRNSLRETGLELATNDLGDDSASSCDAHRSQMVAILEKLRVPLEIATNDFSAVALDYGPGIRRLLFVEEAMEEEGSISNKRRTRSTKNSQGHRESLKLLWLDADHRHVLANSPFRIGTTYGPTEDL